MTLLEQTYSMTNELPDNERYGFTSQMRRAALSIPSNIAEGYGRDYKNDFARFLSTSRGSLMELETQLIAIVRLKLLTREQVLPTWQTSQQVGRMLTALIRSIRATPKHDHSDQQPETSN